MKLMVFPEQRREQVERVVHAAMADRGGTEELTLVIVRLGARQGWSVHATGLGDKLLEQGLSELVAQALKDASI